MLDRRHVTGRRWSENRAIDDRKSIQALEGFAAFVVATLERSLRSSPRLLAIRCQIKAGRRAEVENRHCLPEVR